jgi:hypothetical protein
MLQLLLDRGLMLGEEVYNDTDDSDDDDDDVLLV